MVYLKDSKNKKSPQQAAGYWGSKAVDQKHAASCGECIPKAIQVQGAEHIATVFADLLALEDPIDRAKEHFFVMHLDIKSRVNLVELVSLGSLSSTVVQPRETFRRAVMQGSASIIVGHNHPSGEVEPSDEDTRATKLLFEAAQVLGIQMLDHIVFSDTKYFSFRSNSTHPLRNIQQKGGEK